MNLLQLLLPAGVTQAGSVNRSSKWRGVTDFYPTPERATRAVCETGVLDREVWEPACGDGALSRVLQTFGHEVESTDLVDRGFGESGIDFLQQEVLRAPTIVTNPPYNIANDFVSHALDLQPDTAAFLLRLKFLEGRARYERLMRHRPPAFIFVFIDRVKFFSGDHAEADQPGWNTEAFAWFVWKQGVNQSPQVAWI